MKVLTITVTVAHDPDSQPGQEARATAAALRLAAERAEAEGGLPASGESVLYDGGSISAVVNVENV